MSIRKNIKPAPDRQQHEDKEETKAWETEQKKDTVEEDIREKRKDQKAVKALLYARARCCRR